jgi:hypothetical protein
LTRKHPDTHEPNTPAKGGGKRIEGFYSRGDPFSESVFVILGLAELGDFLSNDGEDSLGGIA